MVKNLNTILISIIGSLIIAIIQSDKIIYVIFAASLIFVFINIIPGSKDKIKIKSLKQDFFNLPYKVIFEAENISNMPNSIRKTIDINCLTIPINRTLLYGQKHKCNFTIKGDDRSIEPHKTKAFEAVTADEYS
jgi:hypothetical protein